MENCRLTVYCACPVGGNDSEGPGGDKTRDISVAVINLCVTLVSYLIICGGARAGWHLIIRFAVP